MLRHDAKCLWMDQLAELGLECGKGLTAKTEKDKIQEE